MASHENNQNILFLDDFVCKAIHEPTIPLANPTNQGQHCNITVLEDLVVDLGAGDKVIQPEKKLPEKIEADTVLASFQAGNQDSLPDVIKIAHNILASYRDFFESKYQLNSLDYDDVVSNVLLITLKQVQEKRFVATTFQNFRAWIYFAANRTIYDLIRQEKKHSHSELTEVIDSDVENPDEVIAQQEESQILARAISELPAFYQQIIKLSYLDGLTFREIAEYLGITVNVVFARLSRARRVLRAKLRSAAKRDNEPA